MNTSSHWLMTGWQTVAPLTGLAECVYSNGKAIQGIELSMRMFANALSLIALVVLMDHQERLTWQP